MYAKELKDEIKHKLFNSSGVIDRCIYIPKHRNKRNLNGLIAEVEKLTEAIESERLDASITIYPTGNADKQLIGLRLVVPID